MVAGLGGKQAITAVYLPRLRTRSSISAIPETIVTAPISSSIGANGQLLAIS
jgi:hypothetical protein